MATPHRKLPIPPPTAAQLHRIFVGQLQRLHDDFRRWQVSLHEHSEATLHSQFASALEDAGYLVMHEERVQNGEVPGFVDLLAWRNRAYRGGEPPQLWIEIKRRGFTKDWRPDNQLRDFNRNDLRKLTTLEPFTWDAFHAGYFVWVQFTDYYLDVLKALASRKNWCTRVPVPDLVHELGRNKGSNETIGRALSRLTEVSDETVCGIVSGLVTSGEVQRPYAMLFTVARIHLDSQLEMAKPA